MNVDMDDYLKEFGMNKFERFMWKATNFMIWRYSRFIMLGFSFSASFFVGLDSYYCFKYGHFWLGVLSAALSLANLLLFLYVGNKYRKEFWT